tara:strand:+ start:2879 stop:3268 length:390 start_codon:yes stop_codon:yes gene_type:complete
MDKELEKKKIKNFGYTFSIIFFLLGIYNFFKINNYFVLYFVIFLILTIVTLKFYYLLKYPSILWEKLGIFLGLIFSPIILLFVYLITIMPINLVIRFLRIDIINKRKSDKLKTYWIKPEKKKINFSNQF